MVMNSVTDGSGEFQSLGATLEKAFFPMLCSFDLGCQGGLLWQNGLRVWFGRGEESLRGKAGWGMAL